MKIFGREPVYVLALVAILLKLGSGYGLGLSVTAQAAIMVVLSCAVAIGNAVVLKNGALAAAIVNLGQAIFVLIAAFGVEMSADTLTNWGMLIEAGVALFIHREVVAPVPSTQVEKSSPLEKKALPAS